MNTVTNILTIIAYIISGWTAFAIVIDILDVVLSRDITSVGWYASHPLAIWKLGVGTNIFLGMIVWLIAIVIMILTALFLI